MKYNACYTFSKSRTAQDKFLLDGIEGCKTDGLPLGTCKQGIDKGRQYLRLMHNVKPAKGNVRLFDYGLYTNDNEAVERKKQVEPKATKCRISGLNFDTDGVAYGDNLARCIGGNDALIVTLDGDTMRVYVYEWQARQCLEIYNYFKAASKKTA